jgi:DNA-binding CsgD family transcriptional regulator
MGNRVGIAQCLEKLARCALIRGHLSSAARLLGSCTVLFSAIGVTPPPDRDPATDVASLKPRLSPAEFARAWEAGQVLSPEDAAAEAFALAVDLAGEGNVEAPTEAEPSAPLGLTRREREVLTLVAEGLTNAQIAERLFLSPKTVSSHLVSVFGKLGVTSRASATRFAIEHGLV